MTTRLPAATEQEVRVRFDGTRREIRSFPAKTSTATLTPERLRLATQAFIGSSCRSPA